MFQMNACSSLFSSDSISSIYVALKYKRQNDLQITCLNVFVFHVKRGKVWDLQWKVFEFSLNVNVHWMSGWMFGSHTFAPHPKRPSKLGPSWARGSWPGPPFPPQPSFTFCLWPGATQRWSCAATASSSFIHHGKPISGQFNTAEFLHWNLCSYCFTRNSLVKHELLLHFIKCE